jgi:hypothetical protein
LPRLFRPDASLMPSGASRVINTNSGMCTSFELLV